MWKTQSFAALVSVLLIGLTACSSESVVGDQASVTGSGGALSVDPSAGAGGRVTLRLDGGAPSKPASTLNCGNSASSMAHVRRRRKSTESSDLQLTFTPASYKEGVQEAMKSFTNLKTYSLPWSA